MQDHVVILGDGQMALVLADALVQRGAATRIWSPFEDAAHRLDRERSSPRLSGFVLHDAVEVTGDDATTMDDATVIINAIPAQYVRDVFRRLEPEIDPALPIVSVTKGIENETLLRPTQVIADVTSDDVEQPQRPMCVLSGPTIAAELAERKPATMVAAANEPELALHVQDLFNVEWLRIYTHDDPLGVELAGATKNVIALAAGMADGLEVGFNAKSALLSRGLAEITRLGVMMGARRETFFGIAGVGDLATTCFCPMGRNRTCGEQLGRGRTLDEILKESRSVVEGVPTTRSVVELARRYDVEMPITQHVYEILFEGLSPAKAIQRLMARDQKIERVG
jgi:glycerol-3-phosphate dehydrogenase (NAD(P)+)